MHPFVQVACAGIVAGALFAIAVHTGRIATALEKQASPPKPVACKLA